MDFNSHNELKGFHAFLSASKYSWLNYDDDKLELAYRRSLAAQRGTELHSLASDLIRLGVKLPRNGSTLSLFVNDVIGFRMRSEQILFYSEFAFGTADAIQYRFSKKLDSMVLQIFDLKTGEGPTSVHQLEIYAALFCLEYNVEPLEIITELRIYQNNDVEIYDADPDEISKIMKLIVEFDKKIRAIRAAQ